VAIMDARETNGSLRWDARLLNPRSGRCRNPRHDPNQVWTSELTHSTISRANPIFAIALRQLFARLHFVAWQLKKLSGLSRWLGRLFGHSHYAPAPSVWPPAQGHPFYRLSARVPLHVGSSAFAPCLLGFNFSGSLPTLHIPDVTAHIRIKRRSRPSREV